MELSSFLGVAGYYRRFIGYFAGISGTLHKATSGNKKFECNEEMTVAFETLKERLTPPPVPAFPEFECPFIVESDDSNVDIDAFKARKKENGKIHRVQYASRKMNAVERDYSACEREILAVIFAFRKFRAYLLSTGPFKLMTDHQTLRYAL